MSDQLPPNNPEAEMAVLSCVLKSPVDAMIRLSHVLNKNHFYTVKHQVLWMCFMEKYAANEPIDTITVLNLLREQGNLAGVGGLDWLNEVEDFAPSYANLESHIDELIEDYSRRKLLVACQHITKGSMERRPVKELLSESESMIQHGRIEIDKSITALQGADRMLDDLQRRFDLKGKLAGLDTGFWRFNSMTEGLQFGEQSLIAARPSMGKTAIGLNIFQNVAMSEKIPSLFISLEMSVPALMRRLLSSYHSMPMGVIRKGSYSEYDFSKFATFREFVSKCPLHIIDGAAGLTISEIAGQVRAHVKKYGTRFVVIDYLQKIKPSSKQEKRTYEVGEVSGQLKSLAVETNAAFLTLAQLNRESEKDKGRAPKLSDLADSGQIERDADMVALIHRKRDDATGETKLIIAKQRDGEVGMVDLIFNGKFCRFENPPIPNTENN